MTEQAKKFPDRIFVQEAFEHATQTTKFSIVGTGELNPFVGKYSQTVAIYRLVEVAEIVVSVDFKPREEQG